MSNVQPPLQWSDEAIARWAKMNQRANRPLMASDGFVQTLFDIINDPMVTGDFRAATIESMINYLSEQYDVDFNRVFDWQSFRDEGVSG